jgi:hypothetical protein
MKNRSRVWWLGIFVLAALFFSGSSKAQTAGSAQNASSGAASPSGDEGVNSGNYNIHQTIDFGYRADWINGNQDTYDTFVNLGQGMRLFDYSLDMHSLNHAGVFFDDLSFSNFGYGGDPNDVSRLRIEKNKWYDFSMVFRRDKDFWDWNLFANPLNPISTNPALSPTTPVANSPHGEDLVRRMQDYDLTLFPESKIRFRLGYSRVRDEGPGFFTTDGGTISPFNTNYSYTTNSYRAGMDFIVAPRTTLSYDEMLTYFKQDNITLDTNFPFSVTNGGVTSPVDLGGIWASAGGEVLPCGPGSSNGGGYPFNGTSNGTTSSPPVVSNPNCNGFVFYSQVGRPRNYMPRELFRFRSNYFKKFETSGSVGYSNADNVIPDYSENVIGWTVRTQSPGGTTAGFAEAKRVSLDADWEGNYAVTDKLHLVDQFHFYDWRIPTVWDSALGTYFTTGGVGLGAPIGVFDSSCNVGNSYSGPTCPFHTAKSGADVTDGVSQNYFAQKLKTNTFEVEYDFNRRFGAHVGYWYENREITDNSNSYTTSEIYYPGGTGATGANYYWAARGACALTPGGTLPTGCTANSDGSITFTAPAPTGLSTPSSLTINEHAALVGLVARPIDTLRITGDFQFGYNDFAFTRTTPRQMQSYKINVNYTPKPWATLSGSLDIHENRDNVYTVNNLEHGRSYSVQAMLTASPKLSVDFGYTYVDIYSQAIVCYTEGFGPPPAGATGCPPAVSSPVPLGALGVYTSTDNLAYGGVMWKVVPRVTFNLGFNGNFVRGTSPYFNLPQFPLNPASSPALQQVSLNALQPAGTLNFNYLQPTSSVAVNIYKGFTYEMAWAYYGFDIQNAQFPAGLALTPTNSALPPLQLENFNGSTATFSVRYAF